MLRNGKVPHTSRKGQDFPPECLSGTMISSFRQSVSVVLWYHPSARVS